MLIVAKRSDQLLAVDSLPIDGKTMGRIIRGDRESQPLRAVTIIAQGYWQEVEPYEYTPRGS